MTTRDRLPVRDQIREAIIADLERKGRKREALTLIHRWGLPLIERNRS